MQVSKLIDDKLLIEIEADAIIPTAKVTAQSWCRFTTLSGCRILKTLKTTLLPVAAHKRRITRKSRAPLQSSLLQTKPGRSAQTILL